MFDCTCNTQNSLLLNQHSGDDAPQDYFHEVGEIRVHNEYPLPLVAVLGSRSSSYALVLGLLQVVPGQYTTSSLHLNVRTSSGPDRCRTYTNMKYLWHARNDISRLMLAKQERSTSVNCLRTLTVKEYTNFSQTEQLTLWSLTHIVVVPHG